MPMNNWNELFQKQFGGAAVGRESSPLTEEQWQAVDDETIEVLRSALFFRDVFSPVIDTSIMGAGKKEIKTYKRNGRAAAYISMSGEPRPVDHPTRDAELILAPVLGADSYIPWRQGESGSEPESSSILRDAAADNADVLAQKEDDFIANGDSTLGIDGFLAPTGRTTSSGNDWSAAVGNVETDILDMLEDLEDNDVSPENQASIAVFVSPTDGRELRNRFGSGSDTTVEQHLLDTTPVDRFVRTKRQSTGTTAMVAVDRRHMRWHILQDVQTEMYRDGNSERSPWALGTWSIHALKIRHAEAFVERTGI